MTEQKINCEAKHAKYQPTDEEFTCPKCGAVCGDFYKEDAVGHENCELLHDEDNLACFKCGYRCSGKFFSGRLVKSKGVVKCACCGGKGVVKLNENESSVIDGIAHEIWAVAQGNGSIEDSVKLIGDCLLKNFCLKNGVK